MSSDISLNPATSSIPDGNTVATNKGRQGDVYTSEIHGKYYTGSYRNNLFGANRTALTVPAIAATLVSVFSLYNPVGSGKNLELVDFDLGLVLATTAVDTVGLYWQGAPTSGLATFTTVGVQGTNFFGGIPSNGQGPVGRFYSALTHSGTPVRIDILSQFGAVTSTNDSPIHKDFDGKIVLAPGDLVSIAMSTTVSTTSGVDLALRWAEWPL